MFSEQLRRSRVVGRARTIGNRVRVKSSSRVRIPPSPPETNIPHQPVGDVCFSPHGGIRTEGTWQGAGGALQPEAARPQASESLLLRHQRNLFCLPMDKRGFLFSSTRYSIIILSNRSLVRHIWKKQQEKYWPRLQRIWRRLRFTEMLMGWRPIFRRLCDCFRHGISRKLTGYGVRHLSTIAAQQRDSRSRTDPRNVKPVIWQHALAGRSLP